MNPRTSSLDNKERWSVFAGFALVLGLLFSLNIVAAAGQTPMAFKQSSAEKATKQTADKKKIKAAKAAAMKLPIYFTPNKGQADKRIKFSATGTGYNFYLSQKGVTYAFNREKSKGAKVDAGRAKKGASTKGPISAKGSKAKSEKVEREGYAIQINFAGANPGAKLAGRKRQRAKFNYFVGSDKTKWQKNIPTFAQAAYTNLYPGIDLSYQGKDGKLKYEFIVAPKADPEKIQLQYKGANYLKVDKAGNLVIGTPWGTLRDEKPDVYQVIDGEKEPVEAGFVARNGTVGFSVGDYNQDLPLVIDPGLVYSTFLGGNGEDIGLAIAVDPSGSAYITGLTWSAAFPASAGYDTAFNGFTDAFVSKLTPSGKSIAYSTFIGGSEYECGRGIAIDASGNAYLTGNTWSANFPLLSAYDTNFDALNDSGEAFVAKLNPAGTALVYSTFLGGNSPGGWGEQGDAIAVDSSGNAFVAGYTDASDFPVPIGYDTSYNGKTDAFVAKLNPSGTALVYSTFLGGSAHDQVRALAVDAAGNAYVTGQTESSDFPAPVGYDTSYNGLVADDTEAFVAKLNPSGTALIYSTFLGATVWCDAIAVDGDGSAYVTGGAGADFPVTIGYDTSFNGYVDAFVTKLNSAGTALIYSTFLGGDEWDEGRAIAVDSAGTAFVAGDTMSFDFPVSTGYDTSHNGGRDAFVTKLDPSGTALIYSTFLGGSGQEHSTGIAIDASGKAYVTGETDSLGFPTANPYDGGYNGGIGDVFVSKLDPQNRIYNPYQDISGNPFLVQMHAHYYPDGPFKYLKWWPTFTPTVAAKKYYSKGYNTVFMTEHNELIDGSEENGDTDLAIGARHIGVFGAYGHGDDKLPLPRQLLDIRAKGGRAVANHPNSVVDSYVLAGLTGTPVMTNNYAWSVPELKLLKDNEAMEIFSNAANVVAEKSPWHNTTGYALDKWDALLSVKRRIWGTATDDYAPFPVFGNQFLDGGAIRVWAESPTKAAILAAVKQGRFYATTGSSGPKFSSISVSADGGVITASTPELATIVFKGKGGRELRKRFNKTTDSYSVQGDEAYVRVELERNSGGKAWSNPIFVGKQNNITGTYSSASTGMAAASAGQYGILAVEDPTPTVIAFEEATLTIPAQASTQTISGELLLPDEMTTETPPWGYFSDVYNFTPSDSNFSPEATLAISYADEDVSLVGEDYLYLYKYNEASGLWAQLSTTVDKEAKEASTKISGLGMYALSADIGTDTAAPVVTINAPATSDTLSGFALLDASATDDHGIFKAAVYLDDIFLGDDTNTADGINLLHDFSVYPLGEHTLKVTAEDASGNTGEASIPVNVISLVAPTTVDITSPSTSQSVEGSVSVEGALSDSATKLVLTVDDVLTADVTITTPGAFSHQLDTSYLPAGEHTIKAYAFDSASNSGTDSVTINVTPDTEAPETTISSGPLPFTNDTTVTFSFSGSDDRTGAGDLVLLYELEGRDDTFTPASATSISYADLPDGSYTFIAKALDWAGNMDASPATRAFVIDTAKPTGSISINSGAAETNNAAVTLSLSASDGSGGGLAEMSFSNDNSSWSAPEAYSTSKAWTLPAGDGNKTVYVRYKDKAGNINTYQDAIALRTTLPDTLAPSASIISPKLSTAVSKTTSFKVSLTGSDPSPSSGIASYDVQRKIGKTGAWADWQTKTTALSANYRAKAGQTIYFRARAKDGAGNTGAWSPESKTIVPFDNNSLISSKIGFGSTFSKASSNFYLGTARYSKSKGESITYKFTGDYVALISTKGKGYSKAKIFVDGKYKKTVDAKASTTKYRQAIYEAALKNGKHTIKIENLGTAGRPRFDVDGLGSGK